jgi:polyvinyl alcohol dehydrogenase (cytochrome)
MTRNRSLTVAALGALLWTLAVPAGAAPATGEALFAQRCAQCHLGQAPKAPSKTFLQMMPADAIAQALISGIMQRQSAGLSNAEKAGIAHYLSGQTVEEAAQATDPPVCAAAAPAVAEGALIRNWGVDARASRLIPASVAQLAPQEIPRLKLKWALDFHGAIRARSQPTFGMGMLFVGSQNGTVFALDPASGCLRWKFRAGAEVRTPVVLGVEQGAAPTAATLAFFGDIIGRVYAVNAATGKLAWKVRADDHPSATITGAPVYHAGKLYVPVSSLEEAAVDASYPCCKFRGSMLALKASSGVKIWKTYTVEKPAVVTGKTKAGIATRGPSGVPIWNSPSLDVKRGLLYVGTGNNYSWPATHLSDSVVAFDMATGKIRWHWQSVSDDAWNVACMLNVGGCPENAGPDFDIGAGTLLLNMDGRDVIAVGRKDGTVFALDAQKHDQPLWQLKLGRGSIQGGVQFAMAWDQSRLYVPISDMANANDGAVYKEPAKPGLYALNPATGALLWSHPADDVCAQRPGCDAGILAAVTAIPGAVFAGHMDGRVRAYDSNDGKVLWSYDTTPEVITLSGAKAHGGSIGGPGPMVFGGMVYVNSGYGLYGHMPGNVLLAFSVDGR